MVDIHSMSLQAESYDSPNRYQYTIIRKIITVNQHQHWAALLSDLFLNITLGILLAVIQILPLESQTAYNH